MANSPLVKTAIHGADPELGPHRLGRRLRGRALRSQRRDAAPQRLPALPGRRARSSSTAEAVSHSIRDNRDTLVQLQFGEGDAARPLLDHRPDGRVRAAERRLPHLMAIGALTMVSAGE